MAHATQEQGYRFQSPMMNLGARPNVYRRSLEARHTTDAFLLAAAGRDLESEEREARSRRYATYGLALTILLAVGFAIALRVL